jgi:hypothetical protein
MWHDFMHIKANVLAAKDSRFRVSAANELAVVKKGKKIGWKDSFLALYAHRQLRHFPSLTLREYAEPRRRTAKNNVLSEVLGNHCRQSQQPDGVGVPSQPLIPTGVRMDS